MPDLGKKYTCYSCHTKFYDLGKPVPTCPKCGADQRDADEAPSVPASRSRARAAAAVVIVEDPPEEEFGADGEVATPATGDEDEDIIPEADRGDEPAADDEEDEEY